MNLLSIIFARSRRMACFAILMAAATGLLSIALISLINAGIRNNAVASLASISIFAALCVARLIAGAASQWLLIRLSQDAIRELRLRLCRQILATPLAELEQIGPARLSAAFGDDMLNIANVMVNLPYALVNLIIVGGCLLYLNWLSWRVFLGIGACLLVGAVSYLAPVTLANRRLRIARAAQDRLFAHFRALVHGIKELRLHAARRAAFMSEALLPAANDVRQSNVSGITLYALAANWNRLLFFLYVGLLMFAFPHLWPMTPIQLAGYILVLLYMMAPLEAIMNVMPLLAQANVALSQIQKLGLALTGEATEPEGPSELERAQWNSIELRNITYDYADSGRGFSLGPIDICIIPGELLFITGGNGSGKTTLVKLLTGLYSPSGGAIYLDGERICDGERSRYRQLFSVVFSDFFLFDAPFGMDAAAIGADAVSNLSRLQLARHVELNSSGFSTLALSQGQRKRLALLVAMLERRRIYVLDEWAADQDPVFKGIFYTEILPELRERGATVIVISHDDRYYHLADRILTLRDGRLIGSPVMVSL